MGQVFTSVENIVFDNFKWIDTRFSLKNSTAGKDKFRENHVSGAVHWDLNEDLSDMGKKSGRHPMPEKESLIELFRSSGLELNDSIAIYDDGGSPFAARAWWLLHYAGFEHVVILLEGFDTIKEAGIPITNHLVVPERTTVSPVWNEAYYASRDDVQEVVAGETGEILLDAREAKRYRGEVEPLDKIAGRIPGAVNLDWEKLLKDGTFELNESLKEEVEKLVDLSAEVTVYCGSGVTAAPVYAMLTHYGYENLRLYIGSYSDWISREDAEIEKG